MTRIRLSLLVVYALVFFQYIVLAQPSGDHDCGTVTRIVDGDTVWIEPDEKRCASKKNFLERRITIRMVGIDAPETHLPTPNFGVVGQGKFGEKATKQLAQLVPLNQGVEYDDLGKDKYHRTISRLFRSSHDINFDMIESGWVIPYIICEGPRCNEDFFDDEKVEDYLSACDEARASGKGIFDPKDPLKEMPFEFRLRMQERVPDKYVGDFYTKRLFKPASYKKVDVCHRVFFLKLDDAKKLGFTLIE